MTSTAEASSKHCYLTSEGCKGYTLRMRQRHSVLILTLLLLSIAACSPGHTGGNIIAFLRAGQLWTIDPSGANAFAIVSGGEPVVGYSWSPDHRLIAFRQLDTTFATSSAAKNLPAQPVTGQIADVPSTVNTFGVDGGTPISIALSSPQVYYSNPFWISNGTHLLYRQWGPSHPASQEDVTWWVAQNDQPAGIAAKSLPPLASLPSVEENNQRLAGSSSHGIISTTLAGTNQQDLTRAPLSGHPLPATLERVLWQPGPSQGALLYAVASNGETASTSAPLQLLLRQQNGQTTPLFSCACTQFAWSPNGQMILYSTGSDFTIFSLRDKSSYTVQAEQGSVPYWSPDSRFLLLDGPHTLHLVQPQARQDHVLLSDGQQTARAETSEQVAANTLLQPVPNSLWASDSRHFLFLTHQRLSWQGQKLAGGEGLYAIALGENGQPQGQPTLVASGNTISQAGWTYQNPNTSFLY
ncbi:MAG TPA: hypothetical protein VL485_28025 [Ktedonobacteraceae bacterium]|nr:hypothetical protein [Ktedonobacteraceae bacterium]